MEVPLLSVDDRPMAQSGTSNRSRSRPDGDLIHSARSDLAHPDTTAIEMSFAGDTEAAKGR
jgi:hypothetical protein